jgi:hypothetical protein
VRKHLSICILSAFLAGCLHHPPASSTLRGCAAPPDRLKDDPLFRFANEILKDSDWTHFRAEYNVRATDRKPQWVTDDRICDKFVAALTRAGISPSSTSLPVAAVRAGSVYLVRFHPDDGGWVFDSGFKFLTVFVGQN